MAKSIVVLMDGTWNTPAVKDEGDADTTNVVKIRDLVLPTNPHGKAQVKIYVPGVGTDWWDRLSGGVFGVGLSEKIQEAYAKLAEAYEPGDQIYLFGFSRGAYSVRSLVGLIRKSGLLKRNEENTISGSSVSEAYSLYRIKNDKPDSQAAVEFRKANSHTPSIRFLGVWDTVGALGIPVQSFNRFIREYYEFHDTELSAIVENAYHAMAIDEWREDYSATMWDPTAKPNQTIEQVWFPGAHADIGGGYGKGAIHTLTLNWMKSKARSLGLGLSDGKSGSSDAALSEIHNSYLDFLSGAYCQFKAPFYRPIGATKFGSEALHESVQLRLTRDLSYKPKNRLCGFLTNSEFSGADKLRL